MSEPDVVFRPTRAGPQTNSTERLDEFLAYCRSQEVGTWSCKKTAVRGDLYKFWFGSPVLRIAGVGVCSGKAEESDNPGVDYTPSLKLWSCPCSPLKELRTPVTMEVIKNHPALAPWWRSTPYRGRPKSIPREVAPSLLTLIVQLNPSVSSLLKEYFPVAALHSVSIPDDDDAPPPTVKCSFTRRVRDTAKSKELKRLYKCKCQVCGYRICVPRAGGVYAEVHHLRPLGGSHVGLDNRNNMLVLCPNCHAEFDAWAMAINPQTGRIACFDDTNPKEGREPMFQPKHMVATDNITYHWQRFCEAKANHNVSTETS
jgi:5-methylcytosine-specific restriction endonuclease McrA